MENTLVYIEKLDKSATLTRNYARPLMLDRERSQNYETTTDEPAKPSTCLQKEVNPHRRKATHVLKQDIH